MSDDYFPSRWKSPNNGAEAADNASPYFADRMFSAKRMFNAVEYTRTGPWAFQCDHRCAHFAGENHACIPNVNGDRDGVGCLEESELVRIMTRETCLQLNMQAIDAADIVTANLSRDNCYGTYAEIGYALAKRKIIFVRFDERNMDANKRADQWYYAQMSLESLGFAPATWKRGMRLPQLPVVGEWETLDDYRAYLQRVVFDYFKIPQEEK